MEIKLGRIQVEPQDIASGDPEDPFECAIAHALNRNGYVDAIARVEYIEIHENEVEYLCSNGVAEWQSEFMEENPVVGPITLVFDEENESIYLENEYQQQQNNK